MEHKTFIEFRTKTEDVIHTIYEDVISLPYVNFNNEYRKMYGTNEYLWEYTDAKKYYVKPHFDIDDKTKNVNSLGDELPTYINKLKDIIALHMNINKNYINHLVSDCNDKLSIHFIVDKYYCSMNDLIQFIKVNHNKLSKYGFDKTIYRKGATKMRGLFSRKDETRTDKFDCDASQRNNDLKKFLAYYTNDNMEKWTYKTKKKLKLSIVSDKTSPPVNEVIDKPPTPPPSVKTQTTTTTQAIQNHQHSIEELTELSNIINIKYISNYSSWRDLLWSLKSIDKSIHTRDVAIHLSQRNMEKWDEEHFDKVWNSFIKNRTTIGTFYYYAKKSNQDEFMNIRKKYHPFTEFIYDYTDIQSAETYCKLFGHNHLIYDDKYYKWNGVYWERLKQPIRILTAHIQTDLNKFYNEELFKRINELNIQKEQLTDEKIDETVIDEKIELLVEKKKMLNKKTGNDSSATSIAKSCLNIITRYEKIEWENKPNLVVFENGVYDLYTGEFSPEGTREDYMYLSTGYDYYEPKKEQIDFVNNLIISIYPIEEERIAYTRILSTCLYGEVLQKFVIANGKGGNGKGVLHELLAKTLGGYFYKGNNSTIQNDAKIGSSPEVANMKHKRCVLFSEPSAKQKLATAVIKNLTGSSEINARMNYSNDTCIKLATTIIMETNVIPNLDKDTIEDADLRRFVIAEFAVSFKSQSKYDEYVKKKGESPYVKLGNSYYSSDDFKQTYRCAFFKILADEFKYVYDPETKKVDIDQFITEQMNNRTHIYCEQNDTFAEWFNSQYYADPDYIPAEMTKYEPAFSLTDLWTQFLTTGSEYRYDENGKKVMWANGERKFKGKAVKHHLVCDNFCDRNHHSKKRSMIVGYLPHTNQAQQQDSDFE
jgi:hypothetical protein